MIEMFIQVPSLITEFNSEWVKSFAAVRKQYNWRAGASGPNIATVIFMSLYVVTAHAFELLYPKLRPA